MLGFDDSIEPAALVNTLRRAELCQPAAVGHSGTIREKIVDPRCQLCIYNAHMAMKVLKRSPSLLMNESMIEPVARRFRALSEPQRLRILQMLESGEKPVHEIVRVIGLSQPTVSRHLQALFDAGLVSRRHSGTSTVYFICDPMVFKLCDLICRDVQKQARTALEEMTRPAG